MARLVLVVFLLLEVWGSAYGLSMAAKSGGWYDLPSAWYLLPAVLIAVFIPVTVTFLFSTFCQLNDRGELLYDSLVARIARRISEDARKRGEINYCPTFWRASLYLATIWLLAALFVAVVGCLVFNFGGFFSAVIELFKGIVFIVVYIGIAALVSMGLANFAEWSSGSDVGGPPFGFSVAFFFVWAIFWFTFCTSGPEYLCHHDLYLSGRDSLLVSGSLVWFVATMFYLFAVAKYSARSLRDGLVGAWFRALWDRACPRVKIASRY